MPIKGLSDIRRFSRGGKIRLGEKRKNANGAEYPAKLDYFLFDPEDPAMLPVFKERYGEKPRRIKIAFASEDTAVVFPQHYKLYGTSGLACKGDGERATRLADGGKMVELDCPGPANCQFALSKGKHGKPGCKQVASLQFFIPEMPVMQVWQIDTSGFHSIVNINSQLDILRQIRGRISFIPVDLIIKPVQAQVDGKKVVVYALDLVVGVGLSQIAALQPLVGHDDTLALPPPDESTPDALFPASQIYDADPETGECFDDDPPFDDEPVDVVAEVEPVAPPAPAPAPAPPVQAPTAPPVEKWNPESDPEVVDLLATVRPAIGKAIMAQASKEGWSKPRLVSMLAAKSTKPPEAAQAAPAAPVAPSNPDGNADGLF